ncbi:MAG: LysR substrate-binding domain-containing protein, partial [Verrucomicrobiota bacterium]
YNHLYYFWMIAREGSVTRAARQLRLSQSTLSAQLKQLEDNLGQPLFDRAGKTLKLTASGQVAFQYANHIFESGRELLDTFRNRPTNRLPAIRIGAVSPLSKNLQYDFIAPVLQAAEARVAVTQGNLSELLVELHNHRLDLILSDMPARTDAPAGLTNHLLGEMPVFLVGKPPFRIPKKPFPGWLVGVPLILPSRQSTLRAEFDTLLDRAGIVPEICAEADDMALIRLLALSGAGLALVPEIVVQFDLADRKLLRVECVAGLTQKFYAITPSRQFANPLVGRVVQRFQDWLRKTFTRKK